MATRTVVFVGLMLAESWRRYAPVNMVTQVLLSIVGGDVRRIFDCLKGQEVYGICDESGSIQCDIVSMDETGNELLTPEGLPAYHLLTKPAEDEADRYPELLDLTDAINAIFQPMAAQLTVRFRALTGTPNLQLTLVPTPRGMELAWAIPSPTKFEHRALTTVTFKSSKQDRRKVTAKARAKTERTAAKLRDCAGKKAPARPTPVIRVGAAVG